MAPNCPRLDVAGGFEDSVAGDQVGRIEMPFASSCDQ